MRPDRVGWTVYDVTDGRTVCLGELPLVGLDQEDANELVDVLNRQDLAIDRAARRLVLDAMRPRVRGWSSAPATGSEARARTRATRRSSVVAPGRSTLLAMSQTVARSNSTLGRSVPVQHRA